MPPILKDNKCTTHTGIIKSMSQFMACYHAKGSQEEIAIDIKLDYH